jgi:hypothetical protein
MNTNVEISSSDSQNKNMLSQCKSPPSLKFNRFMVIIKSIIYFILMTALLVNSTVGKIFDSPYKPNCFEDVTFQWNAKINEYYKNNTNMWDINLIVAGFFIDFLLLFQLFHWVFKGKSWRCVISFLVFYAFRGFIQVI